MEIITRNFNKLRKFKEMGATLRSKVGSWVESMVTVAKNDPRRIIHSHKVGTALTLVSTVYYYKPIYNYLGVSAMWAVMTVVVVTEFSVGATLGKSVNRGIATLVAGTLGVGVHHLGKLFGDVGEAFVIGFCVFVFAGAATFMRFVPEVKARHDYGLLLFILTFSFVLVSGYREGNILQEARRRLLTILIGASASFLVSIALFPVWAGEDLHCRIALNVEKLAHFLQVFGDEYFQDGEIKSEDIASDYRNVLNSKDAEEALANFAWWEPRHGKFKFRHPWRVYLQIGALTRECACSMEALNLQFKFQPPASAREKIREPCSKLCGECGSALREMSTAIKTMCQPGRNVEAHIEASRAAAEELNYLLQVTPVLAAASLLISVVSCTEEIAVAVAELASKAEFQRSGDSAPEDSAGHVAITVED